MPYLPKKLWRLTHGHIIIDTDAQQNKKAEPMRNKHVEKLDEDLHNMFTDAILDKADEKTMRKSEKLESTAE